MTVNYNDDCLFLIILFIIMLNKTNTAFHRYHG